MSSLFLCSKADQHHMAGLAEVNLLWHAQTKPGELVRETVDAIDILDVSAD